jgi:multiple antibiotic resistance protein
MMDELVKFFVVFLVVVEPLSLVPLFAALSEGASDGWKRRMAVKATVLSFAILLLVALGGRAFITTMGISIEAFKIAGGVMLFLIALDMVFVRESGAKATEPEKQEGRRRADISVFPLAFPFIAGPGAIATLLLTFGSNERSTLEFAALFGMVTLVLLVTLALMLLTPRVMRVIGVTGANVTSRLSGVILAALAVQFMLDGLKTAFG